MDGAAQQRFTAAGQRYASVAAAAASRSARRLACSAHSSCVQPGAGDHRFRTGQWGPARAGGQWGLAQWPASGQAARHTAGSTAWPDGGTAVGMAKGGVARGGAARHDARLPTQLPQIWRCRAPRPPGAGGACCGPSRADRAPRGTICNCGSSFATRRARGHLGRVASLAARRGFLARLPARHFARVQLEWRVLRPLDPSASEFQRRGLPSVSWDLPGCCACSRVPGAGPAPGRQWPPAADDAASESHWHFGA